MKIILLKDIKGVGKKFEEKEVSDGYATNFLIPNGIALMADKAGVARVENLQKHSEAEKVAELKKLNEKLAKRQEKSLELEKFRQEQRS